MKIRNAIRISTFGIIVVVPASSFASAGPPEEFINEWTVDNAGNITDTSTLGTCDPGPSGANFAQFYCTDLAGEEYFRTIVAEHNDPTAAFSEQTSDEAEIAKESFIPKDGSGGIALIDQTDLDNTTGPGGLEARAVTQINTGSYIAGVDNSSVSISDPNYVAEIDHYQSVPGLNDAFRTKEGPADSAGNTELLAFMYDLGGSAGSGMYLELDASGTFSEFTSRGDFVVAFADPAQATGTATSSVDGDTLQFDGGDSVRWYRWASDEAGNPAQIAYSEFEVNPNTSTVPEVVGDTVLGGSSTDWVTLGGNVPYYDFDADPYFNSDLQAGLPGAP